VARDTIKAIRIDQGRMHAVLRSNHVHSPLIGGESAYGTDGAARAARRAGWAGRAGWVRMRMRA
jgi:hypothetical protein